MQDLLLWPGCGMLTASLGDCFGLCGLKFEPLDHSPLPGWLLSYLNWLKMRSRWLSLKWLMRI